MYSKPCEGSLNGDSLEFSLTSECSSKLVGVQVYSKPSAFLPFGDEP